MDSTEVDQIFTRVGELIVTLPPDRLAGFIYRSQVAGQQVATDAGIVTVGVN